MVSGVWAWLTTNGPLVGSAVAATVGAGVAGVRAWAYTVKTRVQAQRDQAMIEPDRRRAELENQMLELQLEAERRRISRGELSVMADKGMCGALTSRGTACQKLAGSCPHHRGGVR